MIFWLFCLSSLWWDTWNSRKLEYFNHKYFQWIHRQLSELGVPCFRKPAWFPCLQWGFSHPSSHLIERQCGIVRTVQGFSRCCWSEFIDTNARGTKQEVMLIKLLHGNREELVVSVITTVSMRWLSWCFGKLGRQAEEARLTLESRLQFLGELLGKIPW